MSIKKTHKTNADYQEYNYRACIPYQILFDLDLTNKHLILYGMIEQMESSPNIDCQPYFSYNHLASILKVTRRQAMYIAKVLINKGYIEHKETNEGWIWRTKKLPVLVKNDKKTDVSSSDDMVKCDCTPPVQSHCTQNTHNNKYQNNPYSPLAGDELSGEESDSCSDSVGIDDCVVADSSADQCIEDRHFTKRQLKDLPEQFYQIAFNLFYFYYGDARKYTQGHKSPLFRKHLKTGASNFIKVYDKGFSLKLLREYFEALQYACPWMTGVREFPDRTERYGLATFMRRDRMYDILDKVNNP
jgi:hypothetical protein